MSTRRPASPRPTPTRRPPPRRPERRRAPQLPWAALIGGALVLLAACIVGAILLRPGASSGRPTPPARNTVAPVTPDAVATSVAETVQSLATPAPVTPTSAATPTPEAAVTPSPPDVTPAPTAAPVDPAASPAIQVSVQRDSDVDHITGIATWREPSAQSEIRVLLRRADGAALDKYVSGYRQGADVSGNPVAEGRRVFGGWTGDDGILTTAAPPDTYILDLPVKGWPWTEQFANHSVVAGQRTNVLFDVSLLTVGLRYADGRPADKYARVHLQATDVSGAPVEGASVDGKWTGDNGLATFELTPGEYALQISGLDGYDTWGRFNHNVPGGGHYTVILTLGRLNVETWNADGTLATGVYVQVLDLVTDSRGVSVPGRRIVARSSDNTGQVAFDLTPGFYGVQVGRDLEFVDVPVQSGQTTSVNRSGYVLP